LPPPAPTLRSLPFASRLCVDCKKPYD
jgi:hypothetical protein